MSNFSESLIEDAALAWLESLGYAGPSPACAAKLGVAAGGTDIAPRESGTEPAYACICLPRCGAGTAQRRQAQRCPHYGPYEVGGNSLLGRVLEGRFRQVCVKVASPHCHE